MRRARRGGRTALLASKSWSGRGDVARGGEEEEDVMPKETVGKGGRVLSWGIVQW